jgi:predicted enzyme related to lactoylglutathione lyase
MANIDRTINYIEFPVNKIEETKRFYHSVFGWEFTDWGPSYISFTGAGIDGGFNGESGVEPAKPGILVVLYADDLDATLDKVKGAGATIVEDIYEFPGGRRFHFHDPNGNELAIWSPAGS